MEWSLFMKKDDCLFCQIVAGEIPSNKVYEDDYVYAFEDVAPMMPVHTLIVPKNHYDNIADSITDEDMAHLMGAVGTIAELKGVQDTGFRVVVNTGDDACQSVHHVHVHVLGGAQMNDGNPAAC
jgi:histidine triad (HIT) family protein